MRGFMIYWDIICLTHFNKASFFSWFSFIVLDPINENEYNKSFIRHTDKEKPYLSKRSTLDAMGPRHLTW